MIGVRENKVLPFRQLRRQQGFDSDKQVAEQAGISRAMLSHALAGRCNMSDAVRDRVAQVLKVSPEVVSKSIQAERQGRALTG